MSLSLKLFCFTVFNKGRPGAIGPPGPAGQSGTMVSISILVSIAYGTESVTSILYQLTERVVKC